MVEAIEEIFSHLQDSNDFLLKGGAGSGKTYTLIQVLKQIYNENSLAEVACITFTNKAVDEIRERAPFDRLQVSTIHDFLWGNIRTFQNDLKNAVVELVDSGEIYYSGDEQISLDYYSDIEIKYREWKKLREGTISHDEVILVAEHLYSNHSLLADITQDKFDYILVDEYQDTFEEVIEILLRHLSESEKNNLIGFFGDSMQSIYRRVGDIDSYIEEGKVAEITKTGNRRNPEVVVNLINELRDDGLIQEVVEEPEATNYNVEGSICFLYSESDSSDIDNIKQLEYFDDFDFNDPDETKELYLVHNLIADKAGFYNLMKIYDKDLILKYKDRIKQHLDENNISVEDDESFGDVIDKDYKAPTSSMDEFISSHSDLYQEAREYLWHEIKGLYVDKDQLLGGMNRSKDSNQNNTQQGALSYHIFRIIECVQLYQSSQYYEFLKKTNYMVESVFDKRELKEAIERLSDMKDENIGTVIDYADDNGIWTKDDRFNEFLERKKYVYDRVKEIKFNEAINLYQYVEQKTPYSTQHNIKGAEFDNVFVALDNGGWNSYNFEYLFEQDGTQSVLNRTRKLFYVCCSRAKKNLIVFFHQPSEKSLETAREWFGSENVFSID